MPDARQLSIRVVVTVLLVAVGIFVMLLPYIIKRQKVILRGTATTFTGSVSVPAGAPPPDSAEVMAAIGRVLDPEIGVSIVDLGLVDSLHIDSSGNVRATIILTTPECPYAGQMGAQAAKEVLAVPGVRRVEVQMDPTLPWDPNRPNPKARELYRRRFGKGLPPLSAVENGGCTQSSYAAFDPHSPGKPVQPQADQGAVPFLPDTHRFRVCPCESVVAFT